MEVHVSEKTVQSRSDDDLPPSPANVRENVRQKYLLDMPEDFYVLWEFCKETNHEHPNSTQIDLKQRKKFLISFDLFCRSFERDSRSGLGRTLPVAGRELQVPFTKAVSFPY